MTVPPMAILRLTLRNGATAEERTLLSMRLPLEVEWTEPTGWEWGHAGPTNGDDAVYKVVVTGSNGRQAVRSCDTRKLEPALFLQDCDGADPRQRWTGDSLVHAGSGMVSMIRNEGASEEDLSAQKLGQLQPFVAVFPQECMGQLAPSGPT